MVRLVWILIVQWNLFDHGPSKVGGGLYTYNFGPAQQHGAWEFLSKRSRPYFLVACNWFVDQLRAFIQALNQGAALICSHARLTEMVCESLTSQYDMMMTVLAGSQAFQVTEQVVKR